MNDKMREEFESMMSSQGEWPQAIDKNTDGEYRLKATATAWETWQGAWEASRAALVVELPESYPRHRDSYIDVMDSALVVEAIEDAGVRVKP